MTIPLVFFSLTGLVLWFIIGAKGHWALKAFIILLTLHVCLSVGMSIPKFAGWPSDDRLPDKFLVHWITIKEPDKKTKEDGYIYIWATVLSNQEKEVEGWKQYLLSFGVQDFTEHRAYRTPYTREGHQRGEDAIKKIKNDVAGKADVLLVPNLETGNALSKIMVYFMGACAAGFIVGGKVPVVVTSRADNASSRLASIAASIIAAQ